MGRGREYICYGEIHHTSLKIPPRRHTIQQLQRKLFLFIPRKKVNPQTESARDADIWM
jgi:hypothetical protein